MTYSKAKRRWLWTVVVDGPTTIIDLHDLHPSPILPHWQKGECAEYMAFCITRKFNLPRTQPEIAFLLLSGMRTKEIAATLGVLDSHVRRVAVHLSNRFHHYFGRQLLRYLNLRLDVRRLSFQHGFVARDPFGNPVEISPFGIGDEWAEEMELLPHLNSHFSDIPDSILGMIGLFAETVNFQEVLTTEELAIASAASNRQQVQGEADLDRILKERLYENCPHHNRVQRISFPESN